MDTLNSLVKLDPSNISPIRSKDNFLIFGSPSIEDPEIQEVLACLTTGWLGTGPKVARFECDFAIYKEVEQAIAVSSCSAALHLSMLAAGLNSGDEVITTPLTFCATINAIIHAGATPVLADIDLNTMNIDPQQIAKKITSRTRAILPVHFAGRPCEMDSLLELAVKYDLKLIEDCAHAIETEYRGQKAGTFGDFGCFSFYVTKNIVTGDGGMILARSGVDAARLRVLAHQGLSKDAWKRYGDEGFKHYQVIDCGFKYNMMDLQAAIGIHQLKRIESYWLRRQEIWQRYSEAFSELPIILPAAPEANTRHAYHLFTIQIDESHTGFTRDSFLDAITAHNIGVGVHYLSIPDHPYYQKTFGWKPEDYPNAMKTGRQIASLPISAKLTKQDVEDVVEAIYKIFERNN
jgi:dTDP-4-amino-4,6-dideoxygalactose transaminase